MATIPKPEPGLVIHFNYLWKREEQAGRDDARYARPCAIIVAVRRGVEDDTTVLVAPITHSEPTSDTAAVELLPRIKRHLGLDDARSWIITDEVNEFIWPGFDLQLNAGGEFTYGILPGRVFEAVKASILARLSERRLARVKR